MSSIKWNKWLEKIKLENSMILILEEKIEKDNIFINPFNLFEVLDEGLVFICENNKKYFLPSFSLEEFFYNEINPKEIKLKITYNKNSLYKNQLSFIEKCNYQKTDPILQKEINNWIKYIEKENLTQELDVLKEVPGTFVEYSPFHFKKIKENRLFLRTKNNQEIYLIISLITFNNISLKKQLEEGINIGKYLLPLKKTPSIFRLVSKEKWNKYKDKEKNTLIKNIKNNNQKYLKTHTNNIWGNSTNIEFENINLDSSQKKALESSIKNNVSIINGYAGTGKSVVVKMISNALNKDGWIVSRLCPTGRAAQLINGKTIHSWLEPIIIKRNNRYEIDRFSKKYMQEKECLIIDESSMIDNSIWSEIIRVWNNSKNIKNKKIIFVGDEGQLDPIGEGEPFLKNIKEKRIPITNLKTLHRNKENEDISIFAEYVRKKGSLNYLSSSKSIEFISKEEAFQKVIKESIQMIMPKRNDLNGSLSINKEIKNMMKTSFQEPSFYTIIYQKDTSGYYKKVEDTLVNISDKIIIVKNMWEWNITNGTTGIFLGEEKLRLYNHSTGSFSRIKKCYKFQNLESKKIFYLPQTQDTRSKIELAYAITIHKSQGSEYNSLILFLKNNKIFNSKMLYTGVTRAKKKLYIVK